MSDCTCPICANCDLIEQFAAPLPEDAGRWSMARCAHCGLFMLQPRPSLEELPSLYPENYVPFQPPARTWIARFMHRRHFALRANALCKALPSGGRVLDIGCGAGGFLHTLERSAGWQTIGCDLSRQALSEAHRLGRMALQSEGAALPFVEGSFDAVTLWEVIEHVPDPRLALCEAARVLRPEGVLLLSTPNARSWQARLWGKYWFSWDIPRHLQVFSRSNLGDLLRDTGFGVIGRVALPMERFVAVSSAGRWLALRWPQRDTPFTQCLLWLLGIALWPVLRLIDHTPAASGIALVASHQSAVASHQKF